MFITLALIILCAAVVVIFSQEFGGSFKKIFAIKGVSLFLPLFAASWLVYSFEYWSLYIVYYFRDCLHVALGFLMQFMPFHEYSLMLSQMIVLAVVTLVPVFLIDLYLHKKSYRGYQYCYITSTFLFIVTTIVLLGVYD